ncbi:MAG TPA: molybdopterin cofactor-binding domain-containing protein [Candidatus Limnocylindria bacterium]|nr:molybdopterin cofactor-binding domain-containing protein [Candidatus Limnocylindria bacterium]
MNLEERIRVEPDGSVTAFSGKIEFGQGIRTAFTQLVANELDVPVERVRVVLGDTEQVPFDFGTFGSNSVAQEAPALRRAAAFARRTLIERAATRLGVPATGLNTQDGTIGDGNGERVSYADLVREAPLAGAIPDDEPLLPPDRWRHIGKPLSRVEARDIVTGRARYTADVRLQGLARGAIARPPARGARAKGVDDRAARSMPGVVAVVHDGDIVGVVAEREEQARAAADALEIDWEAPQREALATQVVPLREDADTDGALASAALTRSATYTLPSIASASIGPSAAVALVGSDGATIYAGTHRPFGLRDAVAGRVGLPQDRVRVMPQMSSGTYGRSSAPDVSIEAAVLSKHARRPVLVQWSRAEEFAYSPSRPEAVLEVTAGLDADGKIVAWRYDEHTNVHTAAGPDPRVAAMTSGRNAIPPYAIPSAHVVLHVEPTPLRTANFRSLAAAENVFAIESFVDELAHASHQDPLAFRMRHVDDPRLRRVMERVADASGYGRKVPDRRGHGFACTLYHGTYVAQVAEVEVSSSGVVRVWRVWCVVDPGLVINPDGVRNQVEGGIQQSASWTLLEELRHKGGRVATTSWDTYPIATFRDAPESIEVLVEGDANAPSTGVGEPGAVPSAAAIANAVFAACGARVRDVPLTRERVRKAAQPVA